MSRICVEDISGHECNDECTEWNELGRRLRWLDPERFRQMLRLVRAYVAAYEQPNESREAFEARLARIGGGVGN